MNCPICQTRLKVCSTENLGLEVLRVRYCRECQKYFHTVEKLDGKSRVYFEDSKKPDTGKPYL